MTQSSVLTLAEQEIASSENGTWPRERSTGGVATVAACVMTDGAHTILNDLLSIMMFVLSVTHHLPVSG